MTQKALTLISDNHAMVVACLCMLGGQVCIWFGSNAQCVWKWWSDKPLLTVILFGVPASLFFWHGTKYAFSAMDELWGPRFLGFGMSYVTFPILTWWLANESMFTPKTMLCAFLSFTIVGIQIFWR